MALKTIEAGGRSVHVFLPDAQPRLKIWAHMGAEEARALFAAAGDGIALFAAEGHDWNADLSPWPAKACFRGGEDFAGRAPAQLKWLEGAILQAEAVLPGAEALPRAILGYSLAGLFALWAAAECGLFDMAASVSGSLWFDGFDRFLKERAGRFASKAVYLSLGDREAKTRNARLACVQEATENARALLADAGAECVFELNPGNHFNDPTGRCARGARWLVGEVR